MIEELYDGEVNAGLETDWDGGITAWIRRAPRLSERTSPRREFSEVADWLDLEARRIFPQLKYARTVRTAQR